MIEALGARLIELSRGVTEFFQLGVDATAALARQSVRLRWRGEILVDQLHGVAVRSSGVVLLSLLFLSLVLVTEFSFHMKLVLRQDSLVPAFSTVLLIRELGPVVTALLLTSRVGAGMAAELALMKATEQLDALRMMSLDPVDYLVPPRWLACLFATVSLTLLSLGVGLLGGAVLAALSLGYGVGEYFNTMFTFAKFSDLAGCLVKAAVFGTVIPLVAAYQGFGAEAGSRGVGEAATRAVVQGSVAIIVADFVLTYLLYT